MTFFIIFIDCRNWLAYVSTILFMVEFEKAAKPRISRDFSQQTRNIYGWCCVHWVHSLIVYIKGTNTVLPRSNLTHAVRSRFVRFAAAVRAVRGYGSCGSRLRFVRFAVTVRAVSGRGSCGSRLRFMRFLSWLCKNHCGVFRHSPSFTFYYATILRCWTVLNNQTYYLQNYKTNRRNTWQYY